MKLAAVLVLLMVFVLPAAAQDEAQSAINYCAGELSYELPEDWVAEPIVYRSYGISTRLANSETALTETEAADFAPDDAIITIEIVRRSIIASSMYIGRNTDLDVILQRIVMSLTPAELIRSRSVSTITIDENPAVVMQVSTKTAEIYGIATDAGLEAIGFVLLITPNEESAQWKDVVLDVANSLSFDAPPFLADSENAALTESYASEDCSFTFAHPVDWYVTSELPLTFANNRFATKPAEENIRANVFQDLAFDEICGHIGMCSWVGLVNATPDTVFDGITTFFEAADGSRISRETYENHEILSIYSPEDSPNRLLYLVRSEDTFTLMIFSGLEETLADYQEEVFPAIARSIHYYELQ